MNELALFAGAGGGILAGKLLGWRTVCAVERDLYAAEVLVQRQNDGSLPCFPIWSDISTFDGRPWRGLVDVVSGGFPCQDISEAGKREGLEGSKSSLWWEMHRVISEVRPKYVFIENSSALTFRGGPTIIGSLRELGYVGSHGVLGGAETGAPVQGKRLWILAKAASKRRLEKGTLQKGSIVERQLWRTSQLTSIQNIKKDELVSSGQIVRELNGVAYELDRIKALGNGQNPRVAAIAFQTLKELIENDKNSTD